MRLSNLAITTALLVAGSLYAQTPASKTASSSKPSVKSTAHRKSTRHSTLAQSTAAKSTAPKSATVTASNKIASPASHASKAGGAKTGKKATVAVARRSNQQLPTSDRYREIQQSLSEKGYFAGQPDGNWGPDSVDALKRFQRDQSLTDDGKLGSLSLIALGLGPRRMPPAEAAAESAPADRPAAEKQIDRPTH